MITTYSGRITALISFLAGTGRQRKIPIGPCLVEDNGERLIDIIWGDRGQRSVAPPVDEFEAARNHGDLVLLD